MKKNLVLLLLISFSSILIAQNKLLTVEDIVENSYGKLRPETKPNLLWIPGTKSYSFLDENRTVLKSSSVDLPATANTLTTLKDLNKVLKPYLKKPLKRLPYFKWINKTSGTFSVEKQYFSFNFEKKKVKLLYELETDAENVSVSPDHKSAAFTIKNNLHFSNASSKTVSITNDENEGIVNGQAAHRSEFGITKGIFWSPKSNYIAFYRMDETMVTDYPILEVDNRPMTTRTIKYPMAGDPSHQVSVGIYDLNSKKTIWLKTKEDKEHYYTCITWGPEEKYIYVTHLNRDQNHSKLVKYDAKTGNKLKILFEEKDPQYVEPEEDLIFLPGKTDEFLVYSERNGFKHLYHYNTDGKLIKQITDGKWVVTSFNGFSKDAGSIFITSTKETPVERHLYKVDLSSGKMKKLTSQKASHKITSNSEMGYFIDTYTSLEIPQVIDIIDHNGNLKKTINKSTDPLKEYKLGKTEILTIKAEDGTDLYCRLTLPPDFDKTKKYPAIVYVYGGPHSQNVRNVWPVGRYKLWDQMMAQKGYVIFYVDNRGTDNRGVDFEQATHRHLGTIEVADQLKGVEYLLNTGFIDKNRIGCWGWSYGGFMTTSMLTRSDAFKVGVAGGAVIDWKLYEIMYTERYMDTPQQNPDGFEKANLLNYVKNLSGKKLLLVHGTSDPVVIWQHTLQYAKKAANLNMPLDYYPYIGHGHGVRGKDGLQLYHKITNYFLDNL